MLRSMYSAISGMQGFETKLDVIGNNIANVNTTGFKASRVDFSDVLSQTLSGGNAPSASRGGTNPMQVGLGVKVADIQTPFTQGADQETGNPLDCAINGAGLFVISPDGGTTLYYTRAGNFTIDANGYLVMPDGMKVMGFSSPPSSSSSAPTLTLNVNDAKGNPPSSVTIGQDGSVNVVDMSGSKRVVGYIALATFANPGGLSKVGDTEYEVSPNSGSPTYGIPGQLGLGTIMSGALEMSNVDLTREFTEMIVAQRGFDANSHVIGTANAILQDIVNLKNS